MKILCISDHRDPIVYSNGIKSRFEDVDLVLSSGDLELEYYDFIVSSLNKPLLFVFGNHNLSHLPSFRKSLRYPYEQDVQNGYLAPSFGSTYVGGRLIRIGGVIFAGLGGCKQYSRGINQFTEFAMFRMILRIIPGMLVNRIIRGRYLDVLLTHAPPYGIGDLPDPCHEGFKVFRWFLRVFRPVYHVHGHIHLYDLNANRETAYCQSKVINAYDHTVLEIQTHDTRSKSPRGAGAQRCRD